MASTFSHEMDKSQKQNKICGDKKAKAKTKWAKRQARLKKVKDEDDEMKALDETIADFESSTVRTFSDIPLSNRTQRALQSCGYTSPTEIQKQGIPVALKGLDVLGAAKTGSGKTMAFLIPMLECLWKLKWSSIDGLGALVISPTRELAYQTFEVLRKIGKHHDLSAGLIIGGKEVSFEQQRIQKTNIIVCTPGRLLQHMDETPNFDCSNLKMLVLDEADRILDMGFSETVNAIIENLPQERQTLLYSATQTRSVNDLARLSLHDPEYVSVYKDSESTTPQELIQSYVICDLQDKTNFIYSFIKNHLKSKILVFLSSCKQVKYIYEAYRRLRPGIPLLALYGKQNQIKRVAIYNDFCNKNSAVLFATDIAARGLDFPAVHWVIQLDCPEDSNTYIHRAGRTARYQRGGHSLLILLPSEESEMLKELEKKKVPITEIKANPKKLCNINKKLDGLCAQDQDLKHWAQKSVVSYVRSVYLQSNKRIFKVDELPVEKYAASLGLSTAPRIRFLQKKAKKERGQTVAKNEQKNESNDGESIQDETVTTVEDDFLVLKRRDVELPLEVDEKTDEKVDKKMKTKITSAKKVLRKSIKMNSKISFDDDGEPLQRIDDNQDTDDEGGIDLKKSSQYLVKQDKLDKKEFRERIKQKHRERKMKDKMNRRHDEEEVTEVALNDPIEDSINPGTESETDDMRSPRKKRRRDNERHTNDIKNGPNTSLWDEDGNTSLRDDEELALRLLTD
ncbi:probable ATP-dependent RNA helicase DDX10 [Xenia sp. Carnegie-2017]|uniref:probable ATP-dependent RNA helicase DDX10 n=1 Tax=Xenia sp. Carnegie-2017 TaxID=2897299 RepID=UPI001F04A1B8|nr:probable ATP-dependent RNA helicase DDX10 [Xenia sp. Carnegie-2017]